MNPSRSLLALLCLVVGFELCGPRTAMAQEDMDHRTRKIHGVIPLNGETPAQARRAILMGMYYNKGIKLSLEDETANTVTARWDYRGGIVIFDVRYDAKQIQVLYRDATEEYRCEELRAGVCYKGTSRYYNYMPNFMHSIRNQLERIRRAR